MGGSRTVLGWSCGGFLQHSCVGAIQSIYQGRFNRRPENLQFGESADGRSPNFVKGVNCCPYLGFSALDVML